MSVALITGSAGLIGSHASRHFADLGYDVWGIDNDQRAEYFGVDASTRRTRQRLEASVPRYTHYDLDVRDAGAIETLFRRGGSDIGVVIHAAAQPSHDWAARNPRIDFEVNAVGTLNLLEATRTCCPEAAFIFTSTNKVYGDRVNSLPFVEGATRYELPRNHELYAGVSEGMSIDASTHSPFGVSKAAADLMVQEYGRYFGLATSCFRGGCLTGPGHAGAELHGFLSYLMRCTVTGRPYTIYGYGGKQVRDNIHSADLVAAFEHVARAPRAAAVYNIGGGRESHCSVLEAVALCEQIAGRELNRSHSERPRIGDHVWWISDTSLFERHYPEWRRTYDVPRILDDIFQHNADRWALSAA